MTALRDVKTLAPGQEQLFIAFGASVQKRAGRLYEDPHNAAKKRDAKLSTRADATGPVEAEMYS